jgi:hypothetical protein
LRKARSSALTGPLPSATDISRSPSISIFTTASVTVISSPRELCRRSTLVR